MNFQEKKKKANNQRPRRWFNTKKWRNYGCLLLFFETRMKMSDMD